MKKIKLSVAALLIAGSGFCSGNDTTNVNTKEIIISCEDMIERVREDVFNSRMTEEIADLYIQNLLDIISRVEDVDYKLNTNKVR